MANFPDTESQTGDRLEVAMLPGERWWGLCSAFGTEMPFNEKTTFECDLRKDNYGHQSLSLLCSDAGRAVWCAEPVGAKISGGAIRLESDGAAIELEERAGSTLGEAFRFAASRWFRPTGEYPELLYFSAPQLNTWIELTYHQNQKDIVAYARSMLDHGLPPGILMIDDTWQHGYGEWDFDRRRFPDPKRMMDELHDMGFKVLLWVCPFVSMDTPAYRRIAWGKNPDDVNGWPEKGGFLMSSPTPGWGGVPPPAPIEWWNGVSALLDFTHPNAVRWFTEQLDRLAREYGADGFKFDGGSVDSYAGVCGLEGCAPKTFAHDRNASPAAQSALYGAFALKYKGSEYRNGFGFAGKPVIMRLHDKPHTWKALGRLVPDMLAAGMVGCPYICPDMIGGGEWTAFLPGAPFDPELFLRSAQVHALCPMMQISASPWRLLSGKHLEAFKDAVDLRQRHVPLILELARESAKSGEPMMRAMEYVFPHQGFDRPLQQFMLGDAMLVAPVVSKDASKTVELPAGRWRDDLGAIHQGPATLRLESVPLNRLPHYERIAE